MRLLCYIPADQEEAELEMEKVDGDTETVHRKTSMDCKFINSGKGLVNVKYCNQLYCRFVIKIHVT